MSQMVSGGGEGDPWGLTRYHKEEDEQRFFAQQQRVIVILHLSPY